MNVIMVLVIMVRVLMIVGMPFAIAMLMIVVVAVAVVVIMHYVTVVMLMAVAFMSGTSKEPACLMRSEERYHVKPVLKLESNAWNVVCFKHTEHHLFVDRERHIYFSALHYGGPVLIADGMAKFKGDPDDCVMILIGYASKIHYQHRAQFEAEHNSFLILLIVVNDVAVHYVSVACKRDGIFRPADAFGKKS